MPGAKRKKEKEPVNDDSLTQMENLKRLLRERGMRVTRERVMVYREILEWDGHFSADELYARMRKKGIRISRGSIFNTINLLKECGLLRIFLFEPGKQVYEPLHKKAIHEHFKCKRCGKLVEFCYPAIRASAQEVGRLLGVKVENHFFILEGVCNTCLQRESESAFHEKS